MAARHSSTTAASCEDGAEWRLYAALDKKDEAAHVALVRFVSEFRELQAAAHAGLDRDGDGVLSQEELAAAGIVIGEDRQRVLMSKGPGESFRLPEVITPADAAELLSRCAMGAVLAAADLQRLLRMARLALLREPAVGRFPAPEAPGESVVVVGDLHGSIGDLATVMRLCGDPGKTTYVFNGDFVDRGRHSVEVLAVLCALKLAHPRHVHLNRGNHECRALTRAYGLQKEIRAKYRGHVAACLFEDMSLLFSALPLAAVIGSGGDHVRVLVVHAGLPSDGEVSLEQISAMPSRDGALAEVVQKRNGKDETGRSTGNLRVLEDLLWSDPVRGDTSREIQFNRSRNAGCTYGLGAAHDFLVREGLTTLVRSHEVVRSGLERVVCGNGTELYTVFSHSNYPDKKGNNKAAALRFRPKADSKIDRSGESGFCGAEVVRWSTGPESEPAMAMESASSAAKTRNSMQTLSTLIARHKDAIMWACRHAEAKEISRGLRPERRVRGEGFLTVGSWSAVMSEWGASAGVTLSPSDWQALLAPLAKGAGGVESVEEEGSVDYIKLFANCNAEPANKDAADKALSGIYARHEELAMIFAWMDADGSGTLSREEVRSACEALNARAARKGGELVDPEALFRAMDIDASGALDRHEFMECFRLVGTE